MWARLIQSKCTSSTVWINLFSFTLLRKTNSMRRFISVCVCVSLIGCDTFSILKLCWGIFCRRSTNKSKFVFLSIIHKTRVRACRVVDWHLYHIQFQRLVSRVQKNGKNEGIRSRESKIDSSISLLFPTAFSVFPWYKIHKMLQQNVKYHMAELPILDYLRRWK